MAPTSGGNVWALLAGASLDARTELLTDPFIPTGLTTHQIYILRCASLAFSLLTLLACIIVLYWFANMRRSFRHDLIMLLIIGDGVEGLFFLVFPLRFLIAGPIDSRSAFCQASGFFLAVGIESSDVAVALIAIHTALYMFKPNQGSGQSGLYPYRYWAYAAYTILPVLFASLAFINNPAYTNNGAYCYLPAEPRWPRFALSWIPRYIILLLILIIYGLIYVYVTILIRRFGEQSDMRGPSSAARAATGMRTNQTGSVPPTPPIAYHGLIPSSSDSRPASYIDWEERQRHGSISSASSIGFEPDSGYAPSTQQATRPPRRQSLARALRWKWPQPAPGTESDVQPTDGQRRQSEPVDAPMSTAATSPRQSVVHEPIALPPPSINADETGRSLVIRRERGVANLTAPGTLHQRAVSVPQPLSSDDTAVSRLSPERNSHSDPGFWNRAVDTGDKSSDNTASNPNMLSILHRGPPRRKRRERVSEPVDPSDPTPAPPQPNVSGGSTGTSSSNFVPPHMSADPAGMGKARDKIRRQLRLLFIYPVIYVLVWIIPFISHIFRWDDPNESGPFGLVLTSLISLCIQGFADAVLFGIREKPWRHPRRASVSSNGTMFRRRSSNETRISFRSMVARCFGDKWVIGQGIAAGRTREEMLLDGRFARLRRELEIEEFMTHSVAGPRTEREWWEWLENIGGSWDDDEVAPDNAAGLVNGQDFELESAGHGPEETGRRVSRVAFKEENDQIPEQH